MSRPLLVMCLLLLTGCRSDPPPAALRPDLVGVWLHPAAGLPGLEGYQFESDGSVRFVNMFSLEGLGWEMAGPDTVRIWSRTERYPRPEAVPMLIVSVDESELVLRRAGHGGNRHEVYRRADGPWLGRWTGEHGSFVDITDLGEELQVTIQTGGDFRTLNGRPDGDRLAAGSGAEAIVLSRSGPDCLTLPTGEPFCRRLAVD